MLGPALLNLIAPNAALSGVTELAIFLIILNAGLEIRFADILEAMRGRGLLLAALSFLIPFIGGAAVAAAYDQDVMRMVFLGLCISITALPVAVKLLESLGILHTRVAKYALVTAVANDVANDVAALFILGIVLNMPQSLNLADADADAAGAVGIATLKLGALALVVLSMNGLLTWLDTRDISIHAVPESLIRVFGPEALFGIVIIFVLVFGTISEALGFHFVIGAFFGALFLDKRHFLASRYEDLRATLASITSGFLAPIFFAYLGLEFHPDAFSEFGFPAVVIVVSILSKLFAGWLGGRIVGMANREAIGLGGVLNGRGAMELVVADIAYQKDFIGPTMFSTLVLMGILTTFLTPILFKQAFRGERLAAYRGVRAD